MSDRTEYLMDYKKKHIKRITLDVNRVYYQKVQEMLRRRNEEEIAKKRKDAKTITLSGYIKELIDADIERLIAEDRKDGLNTYFDEDGFMKHTMTREAAVAYMEKAKEKAIEKYGEEHVMKILNG